MKGFTKVFLILFAFIALTMATACAEPMPGDPDMPYNGHQPGDVTEVIEVSFVYDEELAYQAEQTTAISAFVSMVQDEISDSIKTVATAIGFKPTAITPDFPPTYVALGGDAFVSNPICKTDMNNAACEIDISSSCSLGTCNASVAIPVGTWRGGKFKYAGQWQVARMSLTSTMSTPNQTWLNNFMTVSGDTLPLNDPRHKSYPAACIRVDRPTPTTIEVNRNVALQTNCQDGLFAYDVYDIGDSAWVQPVTGLNLLDDDLLDWTGVNTHDGDQKLKSPWMPATVASGSTLFPRMLWNTAATPQPAYTHRFAAVTSGMSGWIAVYSHDRGSASLPGQISPIKGGVYVRTYRYDTTTHQFQTTIACGGTGFGIELVNMLNLNFMTPTADPFYVLQIQSTVPATGCPVQGADTRPAVFGFGT